LRKPFALAVNFDWEINHFDAKIAFLYGNLDEIVYMSQREGIESDDPEKVCRLKKSIFGLQQSARSWNERVANVLLDLGYKQIESENCIFVKLVENYSVIIALYLDDFYVFCNNEKCKNDLLHAL
jgi:hypothetical protein